MTEKGLRIAAFGVVADGGGSGAGSFVRLLRTLVSEGDRVDFYSVPAFTRPRSLEELPGFRFVPQGVETVRGLYARVRALGNPYASAAASQITWWACQRDAILGIERAHRHLPYDFVLCLDSINLWPSKLPVVSWPQSPPHSEWAALQRPAVQQALTRASGELYARAVHGFYAFRWLQARLTLNNSDLILCGSRWAEREWLSFGLAPERAATMAYPIALSDFAGVPNPGAATDKLTFLWLGRAAPRKRLDLFLDAFCRVRARDPHAEALLVGNFDEPMAGEILGRFRDLPGITIKPPVPRAEVASVLGAADVVVQPSENENFGFAIAEALAAGRPVVVGPTNGTADYAGEALFAFDAYDPGSVAAAMERAAAAVRSSGALVAERARGAALEHFDPQRIAERLRSLAAQAIARHARRRRGQAPSCRGTNAEPRPDSA